MPADYIFELDWLRCHDHDNGGLYVRFPNTWFLGYDNPAYVPAPFG